MRMSVLYFEAAAKCLYEGRPRVANTLMNFARLTHAEEEAEIAAMLRAGEPRTRREPPRKC
jgi:hypothetical protein